jgi:hypothetical protein
VRLTITRFKSNFYVILITKRTLLQYFEGHQIHIVTSYGLKEIVENYLAIGRISNWALELMGLNITYAPQTAIKSQTLANFVAKWTETQRPPTTQEHYNMYFNGSFTLNRAGGGVVLYVI